MDAQPSELDDLLKLLAQKGDELSLKERNLSALLSLCEAVVNAQTMDELFAGVLGVLQELTGHAAMALRVYDAKADCLKIMAQAGMISAMVAELDCLPASWGMMADVVRRKETVFTTNMPGEPERVGLTPVQDGFKSVISVPLLSAERLVGTMEFASTKEETWSAEQLRWMELLGRRPAMGIDHIRFT